MKYLSRCLQRTQRNHNFNHHAKCEKLSLTNLFFADHLLMFARGDIGLVELLMDTFGVFFSKSNGIVVNPIKCSIYFGGVYHITKDNISQVTNFKEGGLPFIYLGVLMTSKKLVVKDYMILIDMIFGRVTHWSSRLLNYAG